MSVVAEIVGWFVMDLLMVPAAWLTERLWRLHTKKPGVRRVVGAVVFALLTVVIYVGWFVLVIAVPLGIFLLLSD